MQLTSYEQTYIFLWSFLIGIILSAVYIVLVLWRVISPQGRLLLFVTDLMFVVFASIVNFLFALIETDGRIRGYVLFAEVVSFAVFYLTVGRLLIKSAFAIRNFVKRTAERLYKPLKRLFQKRMHIKWIKPRKKT